MHAAMADQNAQLMIVTMLDETACKLKNTAIHINFKWLLNIYNTTQMKKLIVLYLIVNIYIAIFLTNFRDSPFNSNKNIFKTVITWKFYSPKPLEGKCSACQNNGCLVYMYLQTIKHSYFRVIQYKRSRRSIYPILFVVCNSGCKSKHNSVSFVIKKYI